jgi:hypothetical protein
MKRAMLILAVLCVAGCTTPIGTVAYCVTHPANCN